MTYNDQSKRRIAMVKRAVVFVVGAAFVLSLAGIGFAAEGAAPPPMNPKVKAMLDSARTAIKTVPADAVNKAIESKEKAIYLDVRDPGEFAAGHLPGAMNISRGTLEFNVFNKIADQNAKIYVYCK